MIRHQRDTQRVQTLDKLSQGRCANEENLSTQ
jgi:hypothetical protein